MHLLLSAFLLGTGLAFVVLIPDVKLVSGSRQLGTCIREMLPLGLVETLGVCAVVHLKELKRLCRRWISFYNSFTSTIAINLLTDLRVGVCSSFNRFPVSSPILFGLDSRIPT